MFDVFSVKRSGNMWELHVENRNNTKTTTISVSECAVYLDKAAELMEEAANKSYKEVKRSME